MWLWVVSAGPAGLKLLRGRVGVSSQHSPSNPAQRGPRYPCGKGQRAAVCGPLPCTSLRAALRGVTLGKLPSNTLQVGDSLKDAHSGITEQGAEVFIPAL